MKEEIINFKTAKLAKEKGFNIECEYFYVKPRSKMFGIDEHYRHYPISPATKKVYRVDFQATLNSKNIMHAPTQSLLQKWMREVHNISVTIDSHLKSSENGVLEYFYMVYDVKANCIHRPKDYFKTYEEALEKGLYQALKLI